MGSVKPPWQVVGKSKYGNRKTEYGGRLYDSAKEAAFAADLDLLRRASGRDRVVSWEPQVRMRLEANGQKICDYVCDFVVTMGDGRVRHIDVKSVFTAKLPIFRLKKRLVKALLGVEIEEA